MSAPVVEGNTLKLSLAEFVARCETWIIEARGLHLDSLVIELLCDSVRLAREHERIVTKGPLGEIERLKINLTIARRKSGHRKAALRRVARAADSMRAALAAIAPDGEPQPPIELPAPPCPESEYRCGSCIACVNNQPCLG